MKQDGGPLALAVWHILIQLATRCPQRGLLVNEDGPVTNEAIAKACHLTEAQVADALNLLTSESIGWIDTIECPRQMLVTGSLRSGRKGRPKVPEVLHVNGIEEGPDFHIERLVTVVEHTPEGESSPQFKSVEVLPYEFEILLNPEGKTALEHKQAAEKKTDSVLEHAPEEILWKTLQHWNTKSNLKKVKMLRIKDWLTLMRYARKYPNMNEQIIPGIDELSARTRNGKPSPTFEEFFYLREQKAA